MHFRHFAPEKVPYAHNRYQYEAERHYGILDRAPGQAQLSRRRHLHHRRHGRLGLGADGALHAGRRGAWAKFPNVKRLVDEINARPAAARANALKDKHTFKAEMDDEARSHMFKHLARQIA